MKELDRIVSYCRDHKDVRVVLVTGPAGSGKTAWCQVISGYLFAKTKGRGFDEDRRNIFFSDGDAFGYREGELWVPDLKVMSKVLDNCLEQRALLVIGVVFSEWCGFRKLLKSLGVSPLVVLLHTDVRALDKRYAERLPTERSGNWMHDWFKMTNRAKRNKIRDFERWHLRNWRKTFLLTPFLDTFPAHQSRSSWINPILHYRDGEEIEKIQVRRSLSSVEDQRVFYGAVNGWYFETKGMSVELCALGSYRLTEGWRTDPKRKDVVFVPSRLEAYYGLLSQSIRRFGQVRLRRKVGSTHEKGESGFS